jgi:hypothetical protein
MQNCQEDSFVIIENTGDPNLSITDPNEDAESDTHVSIHKTIDTFQPPSEHPRECLVTELGHPRLSDCQFLKEAKWDLSSEDLDLIRQSLESLLHLAKGEREGEFPIAFF